MYEQVLYIHRYILIASHLSSRYQNFGPLILPRWDIAEMVAKIPPEYTVCMEPEWKGYQLHVYVEFMKGEKGWYLRLFKE